MASSSSSGSVPENVQCPSNVENMSLNSVSSIQSTASDIDRGVAHRNLRRSPSLSNSLKTSGLPNMKGKTRSASLGRDKKSDDLKARYWAFLFKNLQHAVDELYQTCEMDESISECKEVILVLENYTRDFHNLTEWFRVEWEYENTPGPQRPNSLAWEVRKSSPLKLIRNNHQPTFNGVACRKLLFELSKNPLSTAEAIEHLSPKSFNAGVESNTRTNSVLTENRSVEEAVECEKPVAPVIKDSLANNGTLVENSSQTDDDPASSAVKKQLPNIGRKMPAGSALYAKKMGRSIPGTNTCETKTTSASVSSLPAAKRGPTIGSPRKVAPGFNVAAPVFCPRRKLPVADIKSPTTNEPKTATVFNDPVIIKSKIPRSQSDPVFDTGASSKKIVVQEKPYLSAECVKNDNDEGAVSSLVLSSVPPLASSVHSLHVINERVPITEAPVTVTSQPSNETKVPENVPKVEPTDKCNNASAGIPKEPVSISATTGVVTGPSTTASVTTAVVTGPSTTPSASTGVVTGPSTTASKPPVTKPIVVVAKTAPKPAAKSDSRISTVLNNAIVGEKHPNTGVITNPTGRKYDTMRKNTRNVVVVNGGAPMTRNGPRGRQTDPQNRTIGAPERRPTTTLSTPKPKTDPATNNSVKSDVDKNEGKHPTVPSTTTPLPAANKPITAKKDGPAEKWRSFNSHNNHSMPATKSNSFQDGFKRTAHGKYSNNITRSKTSIDLKSTNGGNRAAAANACRSAPPKDKAARSNENDSPRHRRSSKDIDGWETVIGKSRRSVPNSFNAKSKSFDVNNRFNEPSSSTSLPILVLEDEEAGNVASAGANTKEKNVPRQQQPNHNIDGKSKSALEIKSHNKHRNRNNSHNSNNSNGNREHNPVSDKSNEKEQQTDEVVNQSVRVTNYNNYNLRKERPIISNTAIFTTIQPKKKKPNEKDSRKLKGATKENKNTTSINNSPNKHDKEPTSNEDLSDDEESLRKSKELHEKEISLQNEINELQKDTDLETDGDADTEIDIDADSDSTEVDPEIVDLCNNNNLTRRAVLEEKYDHILTNLSWAERTDTLDKLEELLIRDPSGKCLKFVKNFTTLKQFEDLVSRAPGRANELHQRFLSPSRKRTSPDSTILQHKARQAKAKQNREQLQRDKSAKVRELLNKVAEVKAMQAQLTNERREKLDQKLKKAEENRNLHLKNIQEKAHDEAKKQREIAFINELEAQNKRHDFYALCQEQENRLQSILEDRQRRQEEKAAKEAAVEERRKAIEAERQEKAEELREKMRKREERIDREVQEKERERIKIAREKARDREDRLLALQAAQIANAEELQKKIQQKQENSARRHEENIELIRQKAIEIGTPRLTPYQINKLCSVCNVVIDSEVFLLSHLKGRSHQEAVKKYREQFEANVKFNECSIITNAPADVLHKKRSREKERQNTLRKRCKKIRHRLSNRSEEYLKNISTKKDKCKKVDSSNKGRILKSIKEIEKLLSTQGNGVWPNNAVTILERNLFEIIRILEKSHADDQRMFKEFDGFGMLSKVYNLALDLPKNMSPYLPLKCFIVASNLFAVACNQNVENCLYVLLSNNLIQILDFLLNRLNLIMPNSDDRNGMVVYKADTVADVLMNVCSNVLSIITSLTSNHDYQDGGGSDCDLEIVSAHLQDVVSYVVCTGIVDKLAVYCSSVHDNKSADSYFLLHCMELLTQLVETRRGNITNKEDCTQLMATLKATELVGAVSMLYAMLLHQDSMSNDNSTVSAVLRPDVVNVIIATLKLFSKVAELNLKFFQNILGAEGISLQVRHIISYLLRYCAQNDSCKDLLHQVIEFIGFFAIHHTDNQLILQSGSTPTVLQQLSSLPFAYFSNPALVKILFPTLLACCVGNPQNRTILDQEVSYQLLEDFQNAQESKNIPLIKLLQTN
ncbi:S phase cyclin A-associated protein in the endoplasmic reticulum [Planococcus citri]|uniref:S phase cyclin A-associated protein in the endoplasmic reticulum n=1 Tax=Planococcus citri TaxID=170843 RepID=UPI0031FA3E26